MKKLLYSLFILSAFVFVSCDDEEGASSVVGEWQLSDLDYTYTTTTSFFGIELTLVGTGTGYDMNSTINFTDNPNEFTGSGNYSVELTYNVEGQTYTENVENAPFDVDGTWELDGDNLILVANGETSVLTVVSYSEKEVVLSQKETQTFTEDGAEVTAEIDAEFIFTR
ncbi:MAG: hypothetical protein NXI20_07270 [bacterium]|nr:hypothetical protein [bacterium]